METSPLGVSRSFWKPNDGITVGTVRALEYLSGSIIGLQASWCFLDRALQFSAEIQCNWKELPLNTPLLKVRESVPTQHCSKCLASTGIQTKYCLSFFVKKRYNTDFQAFRSSCSKWCYSPPFVWCTWMKLWNNLILKWLQQGKKKGSITYSSKLVEEQPQKCWPQDGALHYDHQSRAIVRHHPWFGFVILFMLCPPLVNFNKIEDCCQMAT